jgi:small subunit ribosomal protein S5
MAKNNEQPKKEKKEGDLEEKVLYINRCSKVVKGGRKFSFSALILVGDGKGRVGYGFGKANELTDAIRKGGEDARRNMISVPIEDETIPHEVRVHHDGAILYMRPAPKGSGVIAGSQPRAVLELAGVKNVMVKSLGGSNPNNLVKAIFKAILQLRRKSEIMQLRGVA